MTITVYKQTATKSKTGKVYAFGRRDNLAGRPVADGGYSVWRLCENYEGSVRGGLVKTWRYIAKDLSHADAIDLMNRRCGYKAFNGKG
jgi:hypothetical protein